MSASSACCKLPPVEVNYTPKGEYIQLNDLKTYTTGPADAKSVILIVYDVFGFSPQIVQGADLLASQGFRVVMPDFLLGQYCTPDMFSGTEEGNKKRADFFSGFPGAATSQGEAIGKVVAELKKDGANVGAAGACWGYKAIISTEKIAELAAVAGFHPSFIAPEDAEKISQPLALLPSQNEDKDVCNKVFEAVEKKNPGKNVTQFFENSVHGWMAARGDLESEDGKKYFSEGYQVLAKFFKDNL